MTASALGLVYGQVIVGAWLRHYVDFGALVVHSVAGVPGLRPPLGGGGPGRPATGEVPELVPAAPALGVLLALQIALGVGAWWLLRPYDGIARPVTLAGGPDPDGPPGQRGLVLAAAAVLTLRSFGRLAGPTAGRSIGTSGVNDLEAVA